MGAVHPAGLAYGDGGTADGIAPGDTLILEVELLPIRTQNKQQIRSLAAQDSRS